MSERSAPSASVRTGRSSGRAERGARTSPAGAPGKAAADPPPAAGDHADSRDADQTTPPAHNHPPALVRGRPLAPDRLAALLAAVPPRDPGSRPEGRARAARQHRRWVTQVLVVDELAQRACRERGLAPPDEPAPARLPAVDDADAADLGSIVAAALAYSPAARTLLTNLTDSQLTSEPDLLAYYARNPDRFLAPDALRRGVDPYAHPAPDDLLPFAAVRAAIAAQLRQAAGRRAFFAWLDAARADVTYAQGHEHPGDPGHPDHEHRH